VPPERGRIAEAMVHLVGARGYRATTVEAVLERAEAGREDFDRHFESKEGCFLAAYDEVAAEFGRRVLSAYFEADEWHDRMWAGGAEALRFFEQDGERARFFVVEVVHAGRQAQARRDMILHQFAELVDAGRDQLEDPKSVSRGTAEIVAGAIYGTVLTKIKRGWPAWGRDFLPELMYMAVLPYLGARAAEEEMKVQPLR
jgi:AcrR family transcriptional regulator